MVKLSASTPSSGITPNPMNTSNAGNAIHATAPLRPLRRAGRLLHPDSGRSERRHLPMTPFMLSTHCCGVICSWNSLAMLSSSVSAEVGGSAWSQDWAKALAFAEVS